jgi:predicted regulator of Ras-like GTPase activity (Roadblock/LC7/MglB family)
VPNSPKYRRDQKEVKVFKSKPSPALNQTLNEIARQLMGVRWIVWLSSSGLARASFPADLEHDRPSAMGAALLSLGERVSKELRGGALHYSMIAGENSSHLLVVLDEGNALLLGLHPQTSIDALLETVRDTVERYALQLGLDPNSPWLKRT